MLLCYWVAGMRDSYNIKTPKLFLGANNYLKKFGGPVGILFHSSRTLQGKSPTQGIKVCYSYWEGDWAVFNFRPKAPPRHPQIFLTYIIPVQKGGCKGLWPYYLKYICYQILEELYSFLKFIQNRISSFKEIFSMIPWRFWLFFLHFWVCAWFSNISKQSSKWLMCSL